MTDTRLNALWFQIADRRWGAALEVIDGFGPLDDCGRFEAQVRFWRVRALVGDGQYVEAERELSALTQRFPDSSEAVGAALFLGRVH